MFAFDISCLHLIFYVLCFMFYAVLNRVHGILLSPAKHIIGAVALEPRNMFMLPPRQIRVRRWVRLCRLPLPLVL